MAGFCLVLGGQKIHCGFPDWFKVLWFVTEMQCVCLNSQKSPTVKTQILTFDL